ncbi:hypothetical protein [Phaeobacter sp. JH209A]|uniref:hypothetical protein n=1 Tax=Phaeobacter sp. JH209A TaxID=3112505 RepID=UPI003A87F7EE
MKGVGSAGALTGKRFWRLYVHSVYSASADLTLDTLEFCGDASGPDLTDGSEAAFRAMAQDYFEQSGDSWVPYTPFTPLAGRQGQSFWFSEAVPNWIGWRFDAPTLINEVRWSATYLNSSPRDVTIQSSVDGQTWLDEWSESGVYGTGPKTTTRP